MTQEKEEEERRRDHGIHIGKEAGGRARLHSVRPTLRSKAFGSVGLEFAVFSPFSFFFPFDTGMSCTMKVGLKFELGKA